MVLANPGQELSADFEFPVDGYYRIELRASVMGKPTVALIRVEGRTAAEVPVAGMEKDKPVQHGLMFVKKGRHRFSIENKNLFPQRRQLPANVAELAVRAAKRNRPFLAPFDSEGEKAKKARIEFNQQVWKMQEAFEWLRLLGVEGDSREIDRFRGYAKNRSKNLEGERRELATLTGLDSDEIEGRWKSENRDRLADNDRLLAQVDDIQWGGWMKHQGKIYLNSIKIEGPVYPGANGASSVWRSGNNLLGQLKKWDRIDEASIELLDLFVPLVFRRKGDEDEADRFKQLYQGLRVKGAEPEEALRLTLIAVLSSTEFLFREERSDPSEENGVEILDDWTMASRLSYFLWSTMPDQELYGLADSGELEKEDVLQQQALRMLRDERTKVFFKSFTGQWLGIDSLGRTVAPDAGRFPEFTQELGEMMKEETVKYVESIFIENRALTELIDSKWSFLNERLAASSCSSMGSSS